MKLQSTAALLLTTCLPLAPLPGILAAAPDGPARSQAVVLTKDGVARLPILAGSVKGPADELQRYLAAISGAEVKVEAPRAGAPGIYVGLTADFPWLKLEGIDRLGREGFLLKSDGTSLYLIAREPAGVRHAVATFLSSLGCRWFFPGKTWEVVPSRKTIEGSWDERQAPSFAIQRRIVYGFGASPVCGRDLADWERHNRMGGATPVSIGHTWHGLDNKADFAQHPDWFALVGGQRKASKPCYTHPEVVRRATEHALAQAARGAAMISMTPPDGLGYCECERCMAVCQGGKPYQEHGTTFARRPDGVLVNVTSETLFRFVNQVATAVAEKYPKVLVGCYAYSAYSHPPSFKLHPNVFLQTTTSFRRTPLTLAEQLDAFHAIGVQSGIRGYFSVYQWDWDYPAISKGELMLPRLVTDLRFYQKANVQSVNAEASCNWGPRGLGYYLAARLTWNVNDDPKALIADFYDQAFGPAALPMERYYVRWLGPYAAVRTHPPAARPTATAQATSAVKGELDAEQGGQEEFNAETLKAAYRDLDEAARLVKDRPDCRARVDQLRLYAHYLYLRVRLDEAARAKDKAKVIEAVRDETVFGARLMDTGMIHSRPLVGKEFYRRFLAYKDFLEGTPEWPQSQAAAVRNAAGQGCRQTRTDIPGRDELERLWAADKKAMGLP
jgi:hypothetical protein